MSITIRRDDSGCIDEIVAQGCDVQIERLSDSDWHLSITTSDGTIEQFWFGSKTGRARVDVRHQETIINGADGA